MVYWIFGTNTSCPSKAMQNGILSIIQAINKPNCWREALILHLVSENELSKPNQFLCLEIHLFLPLNWCETGLWLAQKTWFSKTKVILFFENLATTMGTQMMMFWHRYNDLFTRCLNFSLIYIQFHVIFLSITPNMESLRILSAVLSTLPGNPGDSRFWTVPPGLQIRV